MTQERVSPPPEHSNSHNIDHYSDTLHNQQHHIQTADSSARLKNPQLESRRPGRILRKVLDDDPTIMSNYGDSIHIKATSTVRILFQNVKGLTNSNHGEDYEYYLQNIHSLQVDIAGLAETNTPWQLQHLRNDFLQRSRKFDKLSKTTFGLIDSSIDPVVDTEKYQAGGCLTMIKGLWTTTVQKDIISDPTGLGRWAGLTISGKHGKAVSIISGYRTCQGSINTSGINTTFHREYEFYRENGVQNPRPREYFFRDLASVIKPLQTKGNAIIVMFDANEVLEKSGAFAEWIGRLDLFDVHAKNPAPSTYIGSKNRRIDYIFGCSQIIGHIKSSGTLSYLEGPQSDHRSLFADVDMAGFISYDAYSNNLLTPQARSLRIGNPEIVGAYIKDMLRYYECHNMASRIDNLHQNFTKMDPQEIRNALEAWDRDQGRAMKQAERSLRLPSKPYEWSPQLRNAAILRRYWKLRLRELKHAEDYTMTISRLQGQVQQNDSSFQFPHREDDITISEVRRHLKQATKTLHEMQKGATELRFKTYQDLLAIYKSDTDPDTRVESNRKAKIVKRTIRTERIRHMFRNIRNTITGIMPYQQTGISQIKVPIIPTQISGVPNPDKYQDFIASHKSQDIVWETVLDQHTIENCLLRYNRQSFWAAATSPCGHGVIYDALTFTSLTPEAKELLEGYIPPEWHGNDTLLREFLSQFITPDHIRARPPIKTTMTSDDIIKGFSKWKESTTTSPSGRHLGHYKAIIQDHTLLTCLTKFMYIAVKSGISISRWAKATNVMLEKDVGNPCIHRLRIIHLFEADFNLYMKLQWGKRLVKRAVKHHLLNPGQFGSVPNHTAQEPILLTQLTNDNCRILKKDLSRFDNDASACFDRIIVPLAMLAARQMRNVGRIHPSSCSDSTIYGIFGKNPIWSLRGILFG
jgi:hypothetical protein